MFLEYIFSVKIYTTGYLALFSKTLPYLSNSFTICFIYNVCRYTTEFTVCRYFFTLLYSNQYLIVPT